MSIGQQRARWHAAAAAVLVQLLPLAVIAQQVGQPYPCLRWAHQSTVARSQGGDGSTLWIYGGRARTSLGQAENTWTNALIKLDLDEGFSIAAPPLQVVRSDTNASTAPPRVALGALASSRDGSALYQYFGQFSDTPPVDPTPNRLWQYGIEQNTWQAVDTTGDAIERTAEGASAWVPGVGVNGEPMSFYFGGHQDIFTAPEWPGARIFLSSMATLDLGSHEWRNMTTYGTSGDSGSRNSTDSSIPPILRADSTLTYVPNLGTDNKGVLVAIGGGNENQMIENTILDVYDIGAKAFVKQATQGDIMLPRVNHCAVRGSSIVNGEEQHQIFVYGGHASNRTTQVQQGQDADIYVLSIPSYTWTYVGNNLTSQPPPRAGHTCELLGDQMVVVGGFIGDDYLCEQPGVFVFNTTSLSWTTDYVPNRSYETPMLLRNITGGTGISNSTGGSGWTNPNNNYTATVTKDGGHPTQTSTEHALQDGGGKSHLGAILGGVAGGISLIFVVLFLVNFFARRQRKRERESWQRRLIRQDGYTWTADDDDEAASLAAMPYSDMRARSMSHDGPQRGLAAVPLDTMRSYGSSQGSGGWAESRNSASDNVESDTEGMHVSGMSHLAPRETLRVTNPSVRSQSSLGYSGTQRSM